MQLSLTLLKHNIKYAHALSLHNVSSGFGQCGAPPQHATTSRGSRMKKENLALANPFGTN